MPESSLCFSQAQLFNFQVPACKPKIKENFCQNWNMRDLKRTSFSPLESSSHSCIPVTGCPGFWQAAFLTARVETSRCI